MTIFNDNDLWRNATFNDKVDDKINEYSTKNATHHITLQSQSKLYFRLCNVWAQ